MHKRALLLVNLGTPDAPTEAAVRPYLKEFLSDPRVVSIHPVARWLLLNLIILRTRPKRSAAAYQKVWTEAGSPLLVESEKLTDKVRALVHRDIDPDMPVALAMRYGNPSMQSVIDRLCDEGVTEVVCVPLYPQFASATTGSTIEKLNDILNHRWTMPSATVVGAFYDHPGFIEPQAALVEDELRDFNADHVLFSFHGVPEDHIRWGDKSGTHCLAKNGCCDEDVPVNRLCYRAHCVRTAKALAARLGLPDDGYSVTFQSRLGRTPWLRPYTDETLVRLAQDGVKRLAVFTPAFVADCLETIEEIGMEGREEFLAHGGEAFFLAPCVNADDGWAQGLVDIIRDAGGFSNRKLAVVQDAQPRVAAAAGGAPS